MRAFFAGLALACLVGPAMAADLCKSVDEAKKLVSDSGGQWIELTAEQRLFLAGVYVLDPQTPPNLPFGDRAVLAEIPGNPGGLIFWIDGERACAPMAAPKELLDMMRDIISGVIRHEGAT